MSMISLKSIWDKRQKAWAKKWVFVAEENSKKPKYYILDMFPYPSGSGLHVWHPKWYIATDVIARKKMLQGYNVLHPMGFDTFGLGTENYAIKNNMLPQDAAAQNIARFKEQLKMFGCTYDRNREISTADPKMYKRTQWTFLQLYNHYFDKKEQKAKPIEVLRSKIKNWEIKIPQDMTISDFVDSQRLAYMDFQPINWCPQCKTWLANEDLDNGKCERCGSDIEQKPMRQRIIRITKYADRLLDGLQELTNRNENVKNMQKNRIGKSEWTEFEFQIQNDTWIQDKISVYTTRIDTVFGASYVALAPENPLVDKITTPERLDVVQKYQKQARKKSSLERTELNKDKTWVFCGAYAINPFDNQKVPIYIADYVLANYGSGAVMAVPAHDLRDLEFAQKYKIPFKWVISPVYNLQDKQTNEKKITWVVVVLFDPKIQKYGCICQTKNNNKHILVTWWYDGDMSYEDTAKREVLEEAGLNNIQKCVELWEWLYSRYYHPRKKDNRFSYINPFLMMVDSTKTKEKKLEEHEHDFETIRLDADEMIKQFEQTIPTALHIHDVFVRWVNKAIQLGFDTQNKIHNRKLKHYTQKGVLINSGIYTGMESDDAISKMQTWLEKKWLWKKKSQYKLQDRTFSRQRYRWEPFPVVHVPNIEFWATCEIIKDKNWQEIPFFTTVEGESKLRKDKESVDREIAICLVKHPIENKFLCLDWKQTWWKSLISGGIDNDDPIAGGIREIQEETWYQNIKFVKYLPASKSTFYRPHKRSNVVATQHNMLFELVDMEKTEIAPDEKQKHEVIWIDQKDMDKFLNLRDLQNTRNNYLGRPQNKITEVVLMEEKNLPLTLPIVKNYKPTGTEEGPLANIDDRINVTLPDGRKWKLESNTMPGRAGSSWYRLRYMDPHNQNALVDTSKEKYRWAVDTYVGWAEHITRHMIYARFWNKFLYDIGVVSISEPFEQYRSVWLIMAEDGRKMSKRRWNVIDPADIIDEFGSDSLRIYEMFMWPFDQAVAWSTNGIKWAQKFLEKIIRLHEKVVPNIDHEPKIISLLHQSIKKVSEDIEEFKYNTAISQLMILVNELTQLDSVDKDLFEMLVLLVSPFAPHLAEELWEVLGHNEMIFGDADWPQFDPNKIVEDKINLPIQFNGKMRGTIEISSDADQDEATSIAKADEKLRKYRPQDVKKVIFVPGKIMNIIG